MSRDVDAGRVQVRLDQRVQPGDGRLLVFSMVVDQSVPGSGVGLVSTVDDYHAYFRMLLNHGTHDGQRILSRPAVRLMTTNRLTPEQQAARNAMYRNIAHIPVGQGQHGGWGFGTAVRTYRGDCAPIGQFGWDGGTGTTVYADPDNQLTGILLTQVGMSTPDSPRLIHDFWTTLYQAVDD
ncbi:serine hydrolase [Streptosporangium carneum]|uniref:serine hydrolase n=1 Tax=Streptosporangium carneum TaxID=47481 RepID=UPI003F689D7F